MKAFQNQNTEDENLMLITNPKSGSSDFFNSSDDTVYPANKSENMLRELYKTPKTLTSSIEKNIDDYISEEYIVEYQNFQKKNIEVLSEKLFNQLDEQLTIRSEIVDGLDEAYKEIVYSYILPSIFELYPMGTSLSITADNTLTMTVNFFQGIHLDLESFIFNRKNNKPINIAYTLYTADEDLNTRYSSLENFGSNLRTDFSKNLISMGLKNPHDYRIGIIF